MRTKIFILGVICFLILSCATTMHVKRQKKFSYNEYSFDTVWSAAMKAVMDIGYSIKSSDKNGGIIFAQNEAVYITEEAPLNLNILLKEENGKIDVDCQLVIPGAAFDAVGLNKEMEKFTMALNRHLKK